MLGGKGCMLLSEYTLGRPIETNQKAAAFPFLLLEVSFC